jgi:hypothetical protein
MNVIDANWRQLEKMGIMFDGRTFRMMQDNYDLRVKPCPTDEGHIDWPATLKLLIHAVEGYKDTRREHWRTSR